MRKSKLGIQALRPDDKALEFVKQYRPGVFKVVINNAGDFAGWMPQIPDEVFVIARYLGEGVDGWEWTPSNARALAAKHIEIHRVNYRRIDAWECINEPVAHTVEKMQQLAEFQRVWAEAVRKEGISPIVGNFSIGNPKVLSADGINLMKHFRPAMEVGDHFAYHGYGCPKTLSDSKWNALRYRELFVDAGMTMPVLLTECGVDCGSRGHGYKERWTDAEYVVQLEQLDQALQADPLVEWGTIFCYGHWNWPTFDLTRNCAAQVGEYIVNEGDKESPSPPPPPEDDIGEWLLEELDQHLPPWQHGRVGYNPHTGLARAARLAEPPLGLAISGELRKQRDSAVIVYQFFWRGLAWCRENEYDNIHIVRY